MVLFNINYHINGLEIPSTLIHKDLGLMVSHDLSWGTHYDYLASRAYKTSTEMQFQTTDSVSKKKLLYISLVHSQLTYCSQIWRPYLIKDNQIRKHPKEGNQIRSEQLFKRLYTSLDWNL